MAKGARRIGKSRTALIALTVGMVPSIPSRRGANPKRTWRQTQADVAPNPNLCQLFPIAAHCRFEPFQALGRSCKRHSPLAAPAHPRKHIRQQFCPPNPQSKPGQANPNEVARICLVLFVLIEFFSSPFASSPFAPFVSG